MLPIYSHVEALETSPESCSEGMALHKWKVRAHGGAGAPFGFVTGFAAMAAGAGIPRNPSSELTTTKEPIDCRVITAESLAFKGNQDGDDDRTEDEEINHL